VGITGNALDDDVAAFLLAGADCVIAKPLRTNSLGECERRMREVEEEYKVVGRRERERRRVRVRGSRGG
jgi:hypothetical protein